MARASLTRPQVPKHKSQNTGPKTKASGLPSRGSCAAWSGHDPRKLTLGKAAALIRRSRIRLALRLLGLFFLGSFLGSFLRGFLGGLLAGFLGRLFRRGFLGRLLRLLGFLLRRYLFRDFLGGA